MARVTRIKDLQELLGFSLAEVRVVLDTEDIDTLDRLRSEFRWGDASDEQRRQLLDEAIEANDHLLARLDETLARIGSFRDERAAKSVRLREVRDELSRDQRAPRADGAAGGPLHATVAGTIGRAARRPLTDHRTSRRTSSDGDAMRAETVTIEGHERRRHRGLPGPALRPATRRGGVVVIHHMPGYDEATKEITRRFAAHGYLAICPEPVLP